MDWPVSIAVELATARMMRVSEGNFCPFMPSLVCVFIETRVDLYLSLYPSSGLKTTVYQGIASFRPHMELRDGHTIYPPFFPQIRQTSLELSRKIPPPA